MNKKPRGLADLDALMPAPVARPQPKPAAPLHPAPASVPREVTPAPRPMSRPVSSRGPRLKTRSQVFYLPDEQIDSLGRLSRQTERSKSDLVREALADYLQQH